MTTTALSRASLDAALDLTLTDEQWAAVRSEFAPAVIVAGAGSGKTTSMAARVAWLVGSGYVRPDQVLGLTFTTKATAQLLSSMRSSVSALVDAGIVDGETAEGDPIGEPQVLTYHAFSARILAEHGIRLGREPRPTMLTDGARQQLAYRVVCRSSLPLAGIGRSPLLVTKDLLSLDDELTELGVSPADLREFDDDMVGMLRSFEPLQRIGTEMAATSAQRALLADLVDGVACGQGRARRARLRRPDPAGRRDRPAVPRRRGRPACALRRRPARRVPGHLHRAAGPAPAHLRRGSPRHGGRRSLPGHLRLARSQRRQHRGLPRALPGGGDAAAARFTLSQNRRSGVSILEVANRTSAHLRTVHAGVEPLAAGANGKGQGAVSCALFETYAQETEWVVGEIEATHSARGAGRAVSWSDIAVLAATGADLVAVDSALRRRGIPTQLVGAAALMAQPAVIDLRSMLELVHDPSANPAFVRLAVGPRWRIGARDLAALGDRAAQLAGGRHRSGQDDIGSALDDAVAGTDVVESISLTEALDDLGDLDRYSREAVERFAAMARELRDLRRHVGEPLPEFVLRVMRVTGLEVEAALGSPDAAAQQQHALHAFLDLTADFTELDGRLTLGAFLARLRDAERFDIDLELEVTGPADAVQLLTVHKAKGLEFAYVFVPFVASGAFPGGRGRSQWPTSASTVPWPLRDDCTSDLASFPVAGEGPRAKHYDEYRKVLAGLSELESQRLAYVAFTRAEQGLAVSGHWWGPTQSTRRGPDGFLSTVHQACLDGFGEVVHWAPEPAEDAVNPQVQAASVPLAWPPAPDPERRSRLREVAAEVAAVPALQPALPGVDLPVPAAGGSAAERARIQEWDVLASALLEEARARHSRERVVRLPDSVSASLLMRAIAEPELVAMEIARPMPHPPAPAARRGTEFHAWVETRYGQQSLLDLDDLPGSADADIATDDALRALKEAFDGGPFAHRVPEAVEAPFALLVGGRVVNGRIDAVFAGEEPGTAYDVIDWKTGSSRHVDPMQLALYRLAWSRLMDVPVEQVSAAFVIVGTGEVLRPDTEPALAVLLAD